MASGASAADVRSILSLPAAGPSSGPSQRPTPALPGTKPRRSKPEGISRELYALIGPSAPSLSAQIAKPKFKAKPNLGGAGKAVKWEWREFKNSARGDVLKLSHWAKASSDPDAEYPFAKYNVKSQALTYSQDEYTRLLSEDPTWTKEETDYLFDLAREYDMRFYVIADRYEYPGGVPRTIEDIKDRYYLVSRRLLRNRPWPGDESSKNQLVASFQYDKEREVTRKKYIASLENRTPEQIAEEEALYVEIKRLESNERKFARERDELLRTLAGVESGLASVAISTSADEEAFSSLFGDGKGNKKKRGLDLESPVSSGPGMISLGAPVTPTRKVQNAKSAAQDAIHCIHRTDSGSSQVTKAAHQPVFLRSFKMATPKAGLAPKVTQALGELGINHTRMVMPTRDNLQLHESLIEAASSLVETKKVIDKIDLEILVLQEQLKERQENAGADKKSENMEEDADDARKTEDAEGEVDDAVADVDDDKGDGERATSVATSIRSIGRKRLKRSMSMSSADTTATTATRTSRKRQKA